MAPEQFENPAGVDHRADIFSLGTVLYEMLTGGLPLGRFQPPSQKAKVDPRFDPVVLKTLEKDPDLRYQTVTQLKEGLASANHAGIEAPSEKDKDGGADDFGISMIFGTLAAISAFGVIPVLDGSNSIGEIAKKVLPPLVLTICWAITRLVGRVSVLKGLRVSLRPRRRRRQS